MSSAPDSSTIDSLMAFDEVTSHGDDTSERLVQMAREIEERIRDYGIEDDTDSIEPEMQPDDGCIADLALLSNDFLLSWLPDATTADPAMVVAVQTAAIKQHHAVPKTRPVPRPRLSKMSAARSETDGTPSHQNSGGGSSGSSRYSSGSADIPKESENVSMNAASNGKLASGRIRGAPISDQSAFHYRMQLEFAQKLGFSEVELVAARAAVGPDSDTNKLLSALIQVHDADSMGKAGSGDSSADATLPAPPLLPSTAVSWEHHETAPSSSRRSSSEMVARSVLDDAAFTTYDDDDLRVIVIDGSNVAMSHGNKQVFSCRGIQIVVNWFRQRGHNRITVFVPQWRKETSYPMAPISDQHILDELEQDKVLVYTPSRRLHGRRVVCYDDRFVLQLASSEDAVVVSNDNYRDLVKENPAFKRIVEERLLMYTFVNDRFMPPDDPLGRHGPTLDQFLRRSSAGHKGSSAASTRNSSQLCPYGRKCTYGIKCKYAHPERSAAAAAVAVGSLGRLDSAQYSAAVAAAGRAAGSAAAWPASASGGDGCYVTDSAYATHLVEPCARTPVARSMSQNATGDRRHRVYGAATAATWSQGSVDDEDRTHSLPIDGTAAAVAAAGQQQQHPRAVRLRTDMDVLRECEQRLARVRGAAAASQAVAAAASQAVTASAAVQAVGLSGATAVEWHRRPPRQDSSEAAVAADGRQSSASSVQPSVTAAQSGSAWPHQPDPYEDTCISDPGSFRFLPVAAAAAYDVSSGRDSCGGGLLQSGVLHRQHSFSDPHLSFGYGSGGDSSQPHSGDSPYSSSELVARTSWPYGRSQRHDQAAAAAVAAAAGSRFYNAQLLAHCAANGGGGGATSAGYQELLSGAQQWPYYGEGYAPVLLPHMPIGRPFPAAMLPTQVVAGPVPAGYGFASGRGGHGSQGPAADPSAAAAATAFLPQQAQQGHGAVRTPGGGGSLQQPIEDGDPSLCSGGAGSGRK